MTVGNERITLPYVQRSFDYKVITPHGRDQRERGNALRYAFLSSGQHVFDNSNDALLSAARQLVDLFEKLSSFSGRSALRLRFTPGVAPTPRGFEEYYLF